MTEELRVYPTLQALNACKVAINVEQVRLDNVWKSLLDSWIPISWIPSWYFVGQMSKMTALCALRYSLEHGSDYDEVAVYSDDYKLIKEWLDWVDGE